MTCDLLSRDLALLSIVKIVLCKISMYYIYIKCVYIYTCIYVYAIDMPVKQRIGAFLKTTVEMLLPAL